MALSSFISIKAPEVKHVPQSLSGRGNLEVASGGKQ